MRGTVFIVLYHYLGSGLLLSSLPNFYRSKGIVLQKATILQVTKSSVDVFLSKEPNLLVHNVFAGRLCLTPLILVEEGR